MKLFSRNSPSSPYGTVKEVQNFSPACTNRHPQHHFPLQRTNSRLYDARMFAPQERKLIIGILLLLMMGGVVKSCRHRVTVVEGDDGRPDLIEALPVTTAPQGDERSN